MSNNKISILWPNDFSETAKAAFSHAMYICKIYDAELVMLHVMEAPSGPTRFFSNWDESSVKKKASAMMDAFWSENGDPAVTLKKVFKTGKPYKKIIETASELEINAIVMGTHGAEGLTEFFVGSNASKVISAAPCPVITMRKVLDYEGFRKILVPLDLTLETGEKLQLAMEFAKNFGAEISLLSVQQSNDEETKKRLKKRQKMALERIKGHKIPVEAEIIQSKEDIGASVLKFAADKGADLIMIMTQQEHKDLKERLMGTHAQYVVNHSNAPVMSIRPQREYKHATFSGAHFG